VAGSVRGYAGPCAGVAELVGAGGSRKRSFRISIQFDGHDASERNAIAHLGPALMTAESTWDPKRQTFADKIVKAVVVRIDDPTT
jgi:hypothetical protein